MKPGRKSTTMEGHGMSLHEIAAEMGLTYNQVRAAYNKGMLKLRLKRVARGMRKEDYLVSLIAWIIAATLK